MKAMIWRLLSTIFATVSVVPLKFTAVLSRLNIEKRFVIPDWITPPVAPVSLVIVGLSIVNFLVARILNLLMNCRFRIGTAAVTEDAPGLMKTSSELMVAPFVWVSITNAMNISVPESAVLCEA